MSVRAMSVCVKALPQDRLSPMFIREIDHADPLLIFGRIHAADVFRYPNGCSNSIFARRIR
jgi:hypothetical protein